MARKRLSKTSIQKVLKDSVFDPRKVGHMATITSMPDQKDDWQHLLKQAGYELIRAAKVDVDYSIDLRVRISIVRDAISMAAAGRAILGR